MQQLSYSIPTWTAEDDQKAAEEFLASYLGTYENTNDSVVVFLSTAFMEVLELCEKDDSELARKIERILTNAGNNTLEEEW